MWHGVCFGASRPCIQYWGASSVQQLSEASQMIGRYLLPPPDEERCDTLWRGGETNARVTSQFIFPAVFTFKTYAACYMPPPEHLLGHLRWQHSTPLKICWLGVRIFLPPSMHFSSNWAAFQRSLREVSHSSVHGLISRLSWDKENRVSDKCSWRVVDRYGACCHRSSLCWKVSYLVIQRLCSKDLSTPLPHWNFFWDNVGFLDSFSNIFQWQLLNSKFSRIPTNVTVRCFLLMTNKSIFGI